MGDIENRLKGGHPNSLGNTIEVVDRVLKEQNLFPELFNCYFSDDEVVRLRTSNAMKRICKQDKSILIPYIDRFLVEISEINQASTQWTLAQLFDMLKKDMSKEQILDAQDIMKNNLANHSDWIVLNQSMTTLGEWAKKDDNLKKWMAPHLKRLMADSRKSVASKAKKVTNALFT
ncbi:hypothetical protein QYS48_34200 [Marivirga arenosa]|uniref:Uncharacterized protein n=1 Tax=Marivirga arenosa TaxID=3059076 RepID=A0AA51R8R8_9BACT|nr:hypothetical protein [Marivirga sp. ABR2-2]WMN06906.1 hypothetical protein QYS48_34200 [Marivirga sp. ABR2-2]